MSASTDKRAKNELMFREVNERIRDLHLEGTSLEILWCGSTECTATIQLDKETYEQVRSHARRFLVLPGHEIAERERIVSRAEGHLIVEKIGDLGAIAEQSDPRSGAAT